MVFSTRLDQHPAQRIAGSAEVKVRTEPEVVHIPLNLDGVGVEGGGAGLTQDFTQIRRDSASGKATVEDGELEAPSQAVEVVRFGGGRGGPAVEDGFGVGEGGEHVTVVVGQSVGDGDAELGGNPKLDKGPGGWGVGDLIPKFGAHCDSAGAQRP